MSVLSKYRSIPSTQEEEKGETYSNLLNLRDKAIGDIDPNLKEFVRDESEKFFFQGHTLLATACHLSINDYKNAIQTVLRTNELYLAYFIC